MFNEFLNSLIKAKNNTIYGTLLHIFGIGATHSFKIITENGLNKQSKISDCNKDTLLSIILSLKKSKHKRENYTSHAKVKPVGMYKNNFTRFCGPENYNNKGSNLILGPIMENLKIAHKREMISLLASKSYISNRHRKSLPVRGQRTHSNANTQKKLASSRISGLAGS